MLSDLELAFSLLAFDLIGSGRFHNRQPPFSPAG
jgi:hypothetical protein